METRQDAAAGSSDQQPASIADPVPQQAQVLADEKAQNEEPAPAPVHSHSNSSSSPSAQHGAVATSSAPTSPQLHPPSVDGRKSPAIEEYYASRPKFDRLGNPIPDRKRPGAMSSVFAGAKVRLPGDLGPNDPRRARSPAPPSALPGDLGPNDPRKSRSANSSPAPSGHRRDDSDQSIQKGEGSGRLEEDPPVVGEDRGDSDDDADADNDNDTDADDGKRGRGRKRPEPGKTTAGKAINLREDSVDSEAEFRKPDPTKGESALSFSRDPRIKVTPPSGKRRVHPTTAFDAVSTPLASDDENRSEMLAAQKLKLTTSAVHSTPSAHRVIRQIIRGDYAHFQHEAEQGRKRQRMYLVATDLSPESEYALEWTIGTVLRDGDTLFAVWAVDEEVGVGGEGGVEIGHGADCVRDTAAIVNGLPATNAVPPTSPGPSPLARAAPLTSDSRSHSRSNFSSAETARRRALEDITSRCIHLLRKTTLQVRVVVEVFHCKSPRHMITEVIDFLAPTLVIIGSRGRSAVKGVLLGSFSNYLVTKSSVPVMVARKKLRKHSKGENQVQRNRDGTSKPYTGSGRSGRLSNVIEAPKGLRVNGWDKVGID